MPVKLLFGSVNPQELTGYGDKAFIVTGKSSIRNGSLSDIKAALESVGIGYEIFDRVEENPSVENILEAGEEGRIYSASFVIGIGGGSPMDAAKAVAVAIANSGIGKKELYSPAPLKHLPMLAVPTTAGTGSETTPFAILTVHGDETKASMSQLVFPEKAFLNGKYMIDMPERTTLSTAVDAFAHLAEGYLSSKANFISDQMAESGLRAFGECLPALTSRRFDLGFRNKMLLISSLAGMVITQAKTSLPHQMGYALTYFKHMPHGFANGILFSEYLDFHQNRSKVDCIIQMLGLESGSAFRKLMKDLMDVNIDITKEEINLYTDRCFENKAKLSSHPFSVTREDILGIYMRSLNL